ncbi:MAG: DUF134 domain-containing protein [Candidatus Hydrothermarchaeota archaeon]
MVRPKKCREIWLKPERMYYKPRGIPARELEEINLTFDELEAMRLRYLKKLQQEDAAKEMNISQPTFHRTLERAWTKITDALVNGKAINIDGGNYLIRKGERRFLCFECQHEWEEVFGTGRPFKCPKCSSSSIHRHPEDRGYARRRGRGPRGPRFDR